MGVRPCLCMHVCVLAAAFGMGFNGLIVMAVTLWAQPVGWALTVPSLLFTASVYAMYHLEHLLRCNVVELRLYNERPPV